MKTRLCKRIATPLCAAILPLMATSADAALMDVTVTIENLAATNGVSFAPLRLGFHNGSFDAFDNGSAASDAIVSVAEGGGGEAWFTAFESEEPDAVLGSVVNGGPAVPAGNAGVGNPFSSTATNTFRVDTAVNSFFTFANMVVPSNDLFLGNDNPIRLFDGLGNLLIDEIFQTGASIWDANSEVADPANAAFLPGGVNDNRIEEGGVVAFDFSELNVFDGLTTAAGYAFDFSTLSSDDAIYRISFETEAVAAPTPSSFALLGLAAFGLIARKKAYPRGLTAA
ncbi:MAG: spondin domain-containing protein [Pseudomonadota bacterium]